MSAQPYTATSVGAQVRVHDLRVAYDGHEVVHGIDFDVEAGSVTALVGESGCGKSSTALAISRLLPNTATTGGSIEIGDVDVLGLRSRELMEHRGSLVGYVPQSTSSSLNPVRSVGTQLSELFRLRAGHSAPEARARAAQALRDVEITDPERVLRLHQHQLSGGMRQRVSIAIALALRPRLLIADEPTTALDTTVQREILALFQRLQSAHGITIIWITHDLGVVSALAQRVAVMYAGRIVEQSATRALFEDPTHPYTKGLLASYRSSREGRALSHFSAIEGQPPTRGDVSGCAFHPRCPVAIDRCSIDVPSVVDVGLHRQSACHLVGDR
jgi:oligopeptide/dipeptide ABC transporter ATP-binding protein